MDNGSIFPYRYRLKQEDGEGIKQPGVGIPGATIQGVEVWRKQTELRWESDPLRRGSAKVSGFLEKP